MISPTQRSKKELEADGFTVGIVEKWNVHARIRQDLWGFADLIAMKPGETPLLLQVTSINWASRRTKILSEPRALIALQSGFLIEVHGWRKLKSNRNRWTIYRLPITLEDFACEPAHPA